MADVVQGFGAGDFVALAKFAWKIYSNVRESRANFGKLNLDIEALLVSIGSLDKGHTQNLVADYIDSDETDIRRTEVRALRDGLNSVIMPFYALFETRQATFRSPDGTKNPRPINKNGKVMYVDGPTIDPTPPREKPWRRWASTGWIQRLQVAFELKDMGELRSRFAVQAANLNLFLTRLTHTQLQRQTELLTLRLSEQSLLRDNFRYSSELSEATDDFRADVASYIRFLLDGGKPYTDNELHRRRAETATTQRIRLSNTTHPATSQDRDREQRRLAMLEAQALKEQKRKSDYERGYDYERSYERSREPMDTETNLDDDARLKLAAARQRLAQADLKDDPVFYDSEGSTIDVHPQPSRPSVMLRHQTEPAPEQVILPSMPTAREKLTRKTSAPGFVCDVCDRGIQVDKTFYRCESGRCGGKGDSFDICRRCYSDGESCPGFDAGVCKEMDKVVWKEEY